MLGLKVRSSHARSSHPRSMPSERQSKFSAKSKQILKSLNELNELKLIAKNRGIKGYKRMSEDRLISALNASKSVKESEKEF